MSNVLQCVVGVAVVVELLHVCKQFLNTTGNTTTKSLCLDIDPPISNATVLEVKLS
jgi:hypothetical protein